MPKTARRTKKAAVRKAAIMAPTSSSPSTGPIFFWREHSHEYGFLSQWYPSPFHAGDSSIVYESAEQYMMYQKALLFSDPETGAKILRTTSPKEQKDLGRQVEGFDNEVWLENRERIVGDGSYYKFVNGLEESEDLRALLLGAGQRELVEASPMDRIWGVGFGEECGEPEGEVGFESTWACVDEGEGED